MSKVARKARRIAKEIGMTDNEADACFVMGILHDIGYEDLDEMNNAKSHPIKSEQMITSFLSNKIACTTAIALHGSYQEDLNKYDFVLNKADMTIDGKGNECSYEDRLNDIKIRRGEDSEAYLASKQMIDTLIRKEAVLTDSD